MGTGSGSWAVRTALASMIAPDSDIRAARRERRSGFAAAVAFYPGCTTRFGSWNASRVYKPVAPILILIGEKDDWTGYRAPGTRAG
jgi:dienelactone hydrolase